jgi:uncharacterized protein YhfF
VTGHKNDIKRVWQAYLDSLPDKSAAPDRYEAWSFGDSPDMADELADLVVRGIKTATAGLLWEYQAEGEALPHPGDVSIILDGAGSPACLIETAQVEVKPFNQVDAAFARDEGEGDRSLDYWRQAHWRFFTRACRPIGRAPSETMPVVCERFRVVYRHVPIDTVLETPRCRLRYPALADAPRIHAALRSPAFPRDVPLAQIKHLGGVEARIKRGHSAWAAGGGYMWTIERRGDGALLGQVTLGRRGKVDTWALAYWLDPERWSQGYATEAARPVVDFGFERLGAALIWAGAAVWNQASLRVLEKLGMVHVADNPKGYVIKDEPIPTREYEISRERWGELRG